jgi:hypothetical protein
MDKTVNQYLDIFLSKYNSFDVMKDKELSKLYGKLIDYKLKYGGKQLITPEGECKELINKYLTDES